MDKFKIGDVVMLNSGGIMMNIESFVRDGWVTTVWFNTQGEIQRDDFHQNTLTKVN